MTMTINNSRAKQQPRTTTVERSDLAPISLDALRDTPSGGKVLRARFTKVGVLRYADPTMPTGYRHELRLPQEVFDPASMKTLEHAAVVDVADHNTLVNASTWRKKAVGHVASVKEDGDFLAGEVHVNDRDALMAIEKGERRDVSCGYKCRLRWQPGVWNGENYDCVQEAIVYNHLALCPPNGGRCGPEVAVRGDVKDERLDVLEDGDEDVSEVVAIMSTARAKREASYGRGWAGRADAAAPNTFDDLASIMSRARAQREENNGDVGFERHVAELNAQSDAANAAAAARARGIVPSESASTFTPLEGESNEDMMARARAIRDERAAKAGR